MNAQRRSITRRLLGPIAPLVTPLYEYVIKVKRRLDPGLKSFRDVTGRELVDHRQFKTDPGLAVVLGLGASNIANEGDPNGLIIPQRGVYNFNFFDGLCYAAKDPLLGPTLRRSNHLTRLGEKLIQRKAFDRILLVPIGHGGTYAVEWAPGGRMHPRLLRALRMLRRRNITITHVLWQEGEAEASMLNPDPKDWERCFFEIASVIKSASPNVKIYVAQCTICRHPANEVIRAAQRSVVRPNENIFSGPDLDIIGIDERWDQCHFSAAALDKVATLWFERIVAQ